MAEFFAAARKTSGHLDGIARFFFCINAFRLNMFFRVLPDGEQFMETTRFRRRVLSGNRNLMEGDLI